MTKKTRKTTPGKVAKKPAPADTLTDEELVRSLRASAEELKRLGLDTRDDLVISFTPIPSLNKD